MPADAAIIFLCCGGVLLLIVLIWVVRSLLEPTVQVEPVKSMLTPAEQRFYEALDAAIDGRLAILSKVRIADLFNVTSANGAARLRVFRAGETIHLTGVPGLAGGFAIEKRPPSGSLPLAPLISRSGIALSRRNFGSS